MSQILIDPLAVFIGVAEEKLRLRNATDRGCLHELRRFLLLIRKLQQKCQAIAGVGKVRLQLQGLTIGLNRRFQMARRILHASKIVVRLRQLRIEPDGFLKDRSSTPPVLLGREDHAELKMSRSEEHKSKRQS